MQAFPDTALERILEALERELIEASDADILEAANDLGMKPQMKGSAAFIGLRHPGGVHRPEDFFGATSMLQVLKDPRRIRFPDERLDEKPGPRLPPRAKSGRPPKGPKES